MATKWGWYNLIFSLANDNILNIEAITKLQVSLVLTYLSYQQDRIGVQQSNYNKYKK